MTDKVDRGSLYLRVKQLHGDLRVAIENNVWPRPQSMHMLYNELWAEARQAIGEEPPMEGQLTEYPRGGTAELYYCANAGTAFVLSGQLMAWLERESGANSSFSVHGS